jgi:hypothetical protein
MIVWSRICVGKELTYRLDLFSKCPGAPDRKPDVSTRLLIVHNLSAFRVERQAEAKQAVVPTKMALDIASPAITVISLLKDVVEFFQNVTEAARDHAEFSTEFESRSEVLSTSLLVSLLNPYK